MIVNKSSKLIFDIYYLYKIACYILYFHNLIVSISKAIILYIVDQLNKTIKQWINNTTNKLFQDLYTIIAITIWNFDILNQIF